LDSQPPSPPKRSAVKVLEPWFLGADVRAAGGILLRRARLTLSVWAVMVGIGLLYTLTTLVMFGAADPATQVSALSLLFCAAPLWMLRRRGGQVAAATTLLVFSGLGLVVMATVRGGLQSDALLWLPLLPLLAALLLGRRWTLGVAGAGMLMVVWLALLPRLGVQPMASAAHPAMFRAQMVLTLLALVSLIGFLFEQMHENAALRLQETLAALKTSQDRLESVLDSAQELIWSTDGQLRLQVINGAALAAMERFFAREARLGMLLSEVFPPHVMDQLGPYVTSALAGQVTSVELEVTTLHGAEIMELTLAPNRGAGGHLPVSPAAPGWSPTPRSLSSSSAGWPPSPRTTPTPSWSWMRTATSRT